jgi:hypothetical protein
LKDAIELERAQEKLLLTQGKEDANRKVLTELASTQELKDSLTTEAIARATAQRLTAIEAENTADLERSKGEQAAAEIAKVTKALYLDVLKADDDHKQAIAEQTVAREIKKLMEEANAVKIRTENIPSALVEALVALAQSGQFQAIAEHLAPLSIVRGESLSGTLTQMFAGTPLEGMVNNISNLSKVKTAAK